MGYETYDMIPRKYSLDLKFYIKQRVVYHSSDWILMQYFCENRRSFLLFFGNVVFGFS